ncbi:MAG: S-layer family protein, partial [Gammaproteobacteria bacterium]|nr:S-layer family protein [Gammaproteobacteria bacterium]
VSASGTNLSLTDVNSILLGDIDDAGTFTVSTAGSITQTAAGATGDNVDVSGTSSLTAAGNEISLTSTTNDFGDAVKLEGGTSVSIADANDLILDIPTLAADTTFSAIANMTLTLPSFAFNTGSGDLVLRSNGGTLTTVETLSSTSGNITLAGSGGLSIDHDITTSMAAGTVTLIGSNAGSITGNGTITASQINLQNSIGIGSSMSALNTVSNNIDFSSGNSGSVYLSNNSVAGLTIEGSANGEIQLSEISGNTVTIADLTSLISNGSNNIILIADGLSLGATSTGSINADTGDLTLRSYSSGRVINLGSSEVNTLSVTQDMFNNMSSSGILTIGDASHTGGITIGGNIDVGSPPTGLNDQLTLVTGGSITGATNKITADLLSLTAANTGINVDSDARSLIAHVTELGNINVENSGTLNLDNVDTANGSISISSSGMLTANNVLTGNNNDITLTAAGIAYDTVNAGSGFSTMTLDAGAEGFSRIAASSLLTANSIIFQNTTAIGTSSDVINSVASSIDFTNNNTGAVYINNNSVAGVSLVGDTTAEIVISEISGQTITIPDGTTLNSHGNPITLITDGLSLGAVTTGKINAGTGNLTLQTFNAGQPISLGSGSGLLITQRMFNQMNSSGILTIGNTGQIAGISVGDDIDIDTPANLNDELYLITGGSITTLATGVITASILNLTADDGIDILTDSDQLTAGVTGVGDMTLVEEDQLILSDLSTSDGSINVSSTNGGLEVDSINAGINSVSLSALNGSISKIGSDNITAGQLSSSADTGIDLDTTGTLNLFGINTINGPISILSTGQLSVTDVQSGGGNAITLITDSLLSIAGIDSGSGALILRTLNDTRAISLGAGSGLLITQVMFDNMSSSGLLTIGHASHSEGISIGDVINIDSVATLNGQLDLITSGSITDVGNNTITVATLNLTADSIGSGSNAIDSSTAILELSSSGLINLTSDTDVNLLDVNTSNGSITVNTSGLLTATDVQTGNDSDIQLTANGLVIDRINAGNGLVTLNSGVAGISQVNVINNIEIAASQLISNSASGLDLDTAVSSVSLSDSGTGDIILDNTGAIDLLTVGNSDGSISISSDGQLTATSVQSGSDGDISLSGVNLNLDLLDAGEGTVTLDANNGLITDINSVVTAGQVTFQNSIGIGSAGNPFDTAASAINFSDNIQNDLYINNTSLSNLDLVGITTGNIIVNETGGNLTIAAGNLLSNDNPVQLTTSNGDMIFTGSVDAGTASIILSAPGQINGAGLLSASSIDITAATGIGSSDTEVNTASALINIYNTSANGSYLSNSSATGSTINTNGANAGAIQYTETVGAVIVNGINTAGESAEVNAIGDITLAGSILASGNSITLSSTNAAINGDFLLDGNSLSLNAVNGIGNTTPLVTTASILEFTNSTNDVVISKSSADWNVSGNAGNGNISLTNNAGSLFLKSLVTSGDILLDAASGSIDDANADLVNLTANSATLITGNGIGSSDAIESSINNLSFTNNSALEVQFVNSSTPDLTLQKGVNDGAAISLTQSTPGGKLFINTELISNDADITLISDNMDLNTALDPVTNLPVGKITAGTGVITLSPFDSNQSMIVAGANATFTESLINNLTTSGGLTIGSETHLAEVIVDGKIDTSQTVTGGSIKLLSDANVAIFDDMTNAVETLLVSGNGNVLINGNLSSELNLTLQALTPQEAIDPDNATLPESKGNIHFRDGFELISNTGNILLNSSGSIAGTGDGTFKAATGLLTSSAISMSGDILIDVGLLSIEKNFTTTSGNLTIISGNPISINPDVSLNAAQTVTIPAFIANGNLNISGGSGVILSGENSVANSGALNVSSGDGSLQILAALTASGDVNITASDLIIDTVNAVITATGIVSISDPISGNGIGLAAFQADKLNLDINEYNVIAAEGIVLESSNEIIMATNFSSDLSLVPLTINTNSLVMTGNTRISLASDLDFSSSVVNVAGELDIDVLGSFAMGGSLIGDGLIDVMAETGITMAANSSIVSGNESIKFETGTADIRLGLLDAGTADVLLIAKTGSILNNHGVFLDVTQSKTNVLAGSATLRALDKIGVSSTDAITLNINATSPIRLTFGASTAYINNLFSSPIINNSSGTVAEGFVFSNQILGIGHNLGQHSTDQSTVSSVTSGDQETGAEPFSILGMDLIALLATDEEEDDFISSIIPSVPVMIRTQDGWRFKSPSRQQILDQKINRKNNGFKNIDWF